MREIFTPGFFGKKKFENSEKYHEEALTKSSNNKDVTVEQLRATNFEHIKHAPEVVEETKEHIEDVVRSFYPFALEELQKSGLDTTPENLERNYLRQEDFLRRIIVNFDSLSKFSKTRASYDIEKHRVEVNFGHFYYEDPFSKEVTPLNKVSLMKTLVHEFVHFMSDQKLVLRKDATAESGKSGYFEYQKDYFDKKYPDADFVFVKDHHFSQLNEAVTEKAAQEIAQKVAGAMGFSEKDVPKDAYVLEQKILDYIIDKLSAVSGLKPELLWQGFKAGLYSGNVLKDKNVVRALEECFGSDFVPNFLGGFYERNERFQAIPQEKLISDVGAKEGRVILGKYEMPVESLQKRWEAFGSQKVNKK